MTHDPEQFAATYLEEDLSDAERGDFDAHLLTCEPCWQEICLARHGRELATGARDPAPPGLADDLRELITAAASSPPPVRGGRRMALVLAGAAVVVVAGAGVAVTHQPWRHDPATSVSVTPPDTPLTAAIIGFRDNQLPGTDVPTQAAPDLSRIGFRLVGAGTGSVAGASMSVFAYRDDAGTRLSVYRSSQAFPEGREAHHLGGDDDAWTMQAAGVSILCGRGSHATLLLSTDPAALHTAGILMEAL